METENNEKKPMIRRGSFRVGYGSEEKLIIMCGIGAALCLCMFIVGPERRLISWDLWAACSG